MKMKITVEIMDENGVKTVKPIELDTDIPGFEDFKGPDTFLQDFDVLEKAVLELRNKAAKEAVDTYLSEVSKKKQKIKPASEKNSK